MKMHEVLLFRSIFSSYNTLSVQNFLNDYQRKISSTEDTSSHLVKQNILTKERILYSYTEKNDACPILCEQGYISQNWRLYLTFVHQTKLVEAKFDNPRLLVHHSDWYPYQSDLSVFKNIIWYRHLGIIVTAIIKRLHLLFIATFLWAAHYVLSLWLVRNKSILSYWITPWQNTWNCRECSNNIAGKFRYICKQKFTVQ